MKKRRQRVSEKVQEKIVDALSLPKDGGGVATVVHTINNSEISVEGFLGIIQYTDEHVKLNTPKFILAINGKGLCIEEISTEFIRICGTVSGVEYDAYN